MQKGGRVTTEVRRVIPVCLPVKKVREHLRHFSLLHVFYYGRFEEFWAEID